MVQVIKDPLGSKGARLSAHISIAGRTLVLLPHGNAIGVSQKIDVLQREALRTHVVELVEQFATTHGGGNNGASQPTCGYIVRTNAEGASDVEMLRDMQYLNTTWQAIKATSQREAAPALLHRDLNLMQRVLRDMVNDNTLKIGRARVCKFAQKPAWSGTAHSSQR